MSGLLLYLFEVSVCLAAFYLLFVLAFAKQKYFTLNRWYLVFSLILSFVIPALQLQNGFASVSIVYTSLLSEISISTQANDSIISAVNWQQLVLTLYGIGFLIALFRLARQLYLINQIVSSAKNKTAKNGYIILTPKEEEMIGSFFNYIFWNTKEQFSKEEQQLVIAHEMVHVKEKHSLDMLMVELAGVFLWFNPFIYLLKNAISVNHEFIADEAVSKADTKQYMNLLALQALSANGLSLASYFDSKQIINRMRMLKTNTTRSTITRYLLIFPIVFMLITLFSCENSISAQEQPTPTVEGDVLSEVDQVAVPDGGKAGLFSYILENLEYPDQARKAGVEGKVYIEFVVDKNGEVKEAKVLKGIGAGCDKEALHVVANSPNWTPAVHEGKTVNMKMVLPITFALD
jgi:TonB family protein